MQTGQIDSQIVCPICGAHGVRRYTGDLGVVVWCSWCGAVAALRPEAICCGAGEAAAALYESARQNLLARALLDHARQLQRHSALLTADNRKGVGILFDEDEVPPGDG